MKRPIRFISLLLILLLGLILLWKFNKAPGAKIDEWNGVAVYYNGLGSAQKGRHLATSGYNLGLKWQCVEFVKRYYFEHLDHQMPNSYGHAKDFFQADLPDGAWNKDRALLQFTNRSQSQPQEDDLIVLQANWWNSFGHVGIVIHATEDKIEIIQQNDILRGSRRSFAVKKEGSKWLIDNDRVLGWLRKK